MLHRELIARYAEPWRHYHVISHIAECLKELDRARDGTDRPDELEAAIWFHDAVYVPGRPDNEEASAALADHALAEGGVEAAVRDRVRSLVLATRHTAIPHGNDARLLADIDLAILGADPYRFGTYDRAIRREFHTLSEADYRAGRAAVLRSFMARPSIYHTDPFRERYEAGARANIRTALAALEAIPAAAPD